jgi:hypothetical protein
MFGVPAPAALAATSGTPLSASAAVQPAGSSARAGTLADGGVVNARIHNETNRTLTLKAHHLDAGCWDLEPPQQIPPHVIGRWLSASCNDHVTTGYVTYTVDGTAGQGYAYMPWRYTAGSGENFFGGKAGGLYILDKDDRSSPGVDWTLRCLIPTC